MKGTQRWHVWLSAISKLPHAWLISLTSISRAQVYYLGNIMEGNLIWRIKWLWAPYQPDHKTTAAHYELEAEEGRVNPQKNCSRQEKFKPQAARTATPPTEHIWALLLCRNKVLFQMIQVTQKFILLLHLLSTRSKPSSTQSMLNFLGSLEEVWFLEAASNEILRDTTIRKNVAQAVFYLQCLHPSPQ